MVNKVFESSLDKDSLVILKIKQNKKPIANKLFDLELLWEYFKRATYKFIKIFFNLQPIRQYREKIHQSKTENYRKSLFPIQSEDQKILDDLQKIGTYSVDIQDLGFDSTPALLEKTKLLVDFLKQEPINKKLFINLEPSIFADYPEIFLWGLEPRLLKILEHHIGSPVYYQGYSMRRDIVSKESNFNCIRAWHQDAEDKIVIKIIIYLNDVGSKGGCYQYIPSNLSKEAAQKLNYNFGYIDDRKMETVVPRQNWMGSIGKLGTVIISNTSSVFHRAKPPEQEDRFSISFCYTSDRPNFYRNYSKIFPKNLAEISVGLTEYQRKALVNNNKFFGLKLWLLKTKN